ncbi:MAG: glycosyltransferase [Candidatus Schekmanbacteria bacterium]|nr:MAG: glycosyltransferase [Candidatus Schekmanbacteria bacterium]
MAKISVIMAVYNAERFLAEAIESILNQTFRDFEFIIVNDGSSDNSEKIIESYDDSRIKLMTFKNNRGLSFALNRGIEKSSGEYIARMDADDISMPDRFEKQIKHLIDNPEIDILGSAVVEIDEVGKFLAIRKLPLKDYEIKKELIRSNPFFHSTIMMKRSAFEKAGYYDESIRQTVEDWDLWFRMSTKCKMENLEEPLVKRRFHKDNLSVESNNELLIKGIEIRRKYIKKGLYPISAYRHLLKPLIAYLLPLPIKKFIREKIFKSNIYR